MDANELLHYLRGVFELVEHPTEGQIRAIRMEVLQAQPVRAQIIPVEVANVAKRLDENQSFDTSNFKG